MKQISSWLRIQSLATWTLQIFVFMEISMVPLNAFTTKLSIHLQEQKTMLSPAFIFQSSPMIVRKRRNTMFELQYGLYEVQEEMITNRAKYEEELMQGQCETIQASKPKGTGSSGGFGGGKKSSSNSALKAQGKGHAKQLRAEGVVRIDDVLSKKLCDELKEFVMKLRQTSEEEVESNKIEHRYRFADVLLKKNRCDLTMPLCEETYQGLYEALCRSSVGQTMEQLLGKKAVLYEFSCLISDSGSDRQVIHPDTPCSRGENGSDEDPVLYTCFIALQDVDSTMGPTLWIPGTHTSEAHEQFQQDEAPSASGTNDDEDGTVKPDSPKDALLRKVPYVLGLLPKGCCGIFDSRLLHCGTANRSIDGTSRAVFYFSFKNPKIGYPGNPASIRPELQNQLTLSQLQKQLNAYSKQKDYSELQQIASKMK